MISASNEGALYRRPLAGLKSLFLILVETYKYYQMEDKTNMKGGQFRNNQCRANIVKMLLRVKFIKSPCGWISQ
jgi:hypothetical protein